MLQSSVGKLPEYPHPVASSISSRMMVELGMVTAFMAAAAAVVGGFLASAVFAVTSFIYATTVYVVWPIAKPFFKLFLGIAFGILERVWDNVVDIFGEGGIVSSKFYASELRRLMHDIFFTFCRTYGKGLIFHGLKLKLVLMSVSLETHFPISLCYIF